MLSRRIELILLLLIIAGSFLVRLYRIDNPIADWHSWRQADTSAVSRNFIKNGFDLLHPRFDDLSKIPSEKENPQGWRFVEFPLYNLAQAGFFKLFGSFTLEVWGRFTSIVASVASIIFLHLIVRKRLGARIALLSAAFFGFMPFNIYYGRTILPDTSMVMAILGGTYFFDLAIEKEFPISNFQFPIFFILSIIFTASAFLLKPFALFFTLPMIYLAFEKWGISFLTRRELWLFAAVTLAPLAFWRFWMLHYPEGIPVTGWLFNENNIRFKGAFFYWLFADRLGRLMLGYWGLALIVLGLIRKTSEKEQWFFYSFLLSSLLYMVVIAGGNVKHDYYQILIVPTLAIFLAKGADFLLTDSKELNSKTSRFLLLAICLIFMIAFGWYHIRDYFNVNNWGIVEAGRKAEAVLPKDAKIIAPYGGDTSFLYQTGRRGWPLVDAPIEKMIERGAEYLIIANPTKQDFEGFGRMFEIVATGERYLILDLHK